MDLFGSAQLDNRHQPLNLVNLLLIVLQVKSNCCSQREHAEIKGKLTVFDSTKSVFVGFKVVVYFDDGKAVTFSRCKFYLFFMTKILFFVHGWFILYFSWCKNYLSFIIEIVSFLYGWILLVSIHNIMLYNMVFCLNIFQDRTFKIKYKVP